MSTDTTSISPTPTIANPEEAGDLESSLKKSEKLSSEPAYPSPFIPASNPTHFPSLPPGLVLTSIEGSERLLLNFDRVPLHPLDPLAMSRGWKIWMTSFSAVLVMSTALASSAPTGGAPYIQEQFGGDVVLVLSMYLLGYCAGPFVAAPSSEAYGRRPVFLYGTLIYTAFSGACIAAPNFGSLLVLRFFAGFFGSVPTTNSGAVCGDIWNPLQRGTAMAFYSVATFAGPSLGPMMGAYTAINVGWRYIFVELTAFSAFLCVIIIFLCPETYPPILIKRLAISLRASTGDHRIISRLEVEEQAVALAGAPKITRWKRESARVLGTPFIMLATEPIVGLLSLFMALTYGLVYLIFVAFPIVFDQTLSPGDSSLPFLSIIVGAIISVPISLSYQRKYIREVKALGRSEPEMRLPMAELGGCLIVVAFLWLGWGGYKPTTPWIVPALSGIPLGIASVMIFRSLQTYLLDAFERAAASALAASVVSRSVFGAIFPLFATSLFTKLGINWACTLLAGLMMFLVPVPFMFRKYGARIRKNSRFAQGRG